jgi:hypothetical protein
MIERIARKQLYDLIWSKPLTKVQLELGLTYAQIKSICIEKKIPIPGSGFWIKKEYGKSLTILPLVEDPDIEDEIHFPKRKTKKIQDVKVELKRVVKDWHPLVKSFMEKYAVHKKEIQKDGWSNALRGELNIHVKDAHFKRATRIFNTLINSMEKRGFEIKIEYNSTRVKINDHTYYYLSLRTKHKRVIDEKGSKYYVATKLVPEDILIFKIARIESYEFQDTPNKPLEEKLESIVSRLESLVAKDTQMAAEAKIRNEIYRLERERREAEQKAREEEKKKFEQLILDAENWKKALLITKYLDEIESKPNLNQIEIDYIKWGRMSARRLNPITMIFNLCDDY